MANTEFVNRLQDPKAVGIMAIGAGAAAYYAYRKTNVDRFTNIEITTEQAVSMFSLLAGIGGAASQIIASSRLSGLEGDSLTINNLFAPLLVTIGASAGSAFLLPSE